MTIAPGVVSATQGAYTAHNSLLRTYSQIPAAGYPLDTSIEGT